MFVNVLWIYERPKGQIATFFMKVKRISFYNFYPRYREALQVIKVTTILGFESLINVETQDNKLYLSTI